MPLDPANVAPLPHLPECRRRIALESTTAIRCTCPRQAEICADCDPCTCAQLSQPSTSGASLAKFEAQFSAIGGASVNLSAGADDGDPLTDPERHFRYYGIRMNGADGEAKPTRFKCPSCSGTGGSEAGLCPMCRGSGSVTLRGNPAP